MRRAGCSAAAAQAEAIGATNLASASREQMVYNVDCLKTNIPEALELLADVVFNPRFAPWEVKAQKEKLAQDLKGIKNKPQMSILEVPPPLSVPCQSPHSHALSAAALFLQRQTFHSKASPAATRTAGSSSARATALTPTDCLALLNQTASWRQGAASAPKLPLLLLRTRLRLAGDCSPVQGLHEVAWTGGLARPLVCPAEAVDAITPEGVARFHAEHYVPGKIVLCGECPSSQLQAIYASCRILILPLPLPPGCSTWRHDGRQQHAAR